MGNAPTKRNTRSLRSAIPSQASGIAPIKVTMPRQIQQEKGAARRGERDPAKEREQAGFLLALRAIALGQESVAALLGLGEHGGVFR